MADSFHVKALQSLESDHNVDLSEYNRLGTTERHLSEHYI